MHPGFTGEQTENARISPRLKGLFMTLAGAGIVLLSIYIAGRK